MSDRRAVTLIPGDGIGPEITEATLSVLEALKAPFKWDVQKAGMTALEENGDLLPEATLESLSRTKLALKGPLTTPVGKGFRSINVTLRQRFDLYANVRPTRTLLPGGRFEHVDLVVVRENIEGLYAAMEHYLPVGGDPEAVAYGAGFNTRQECARIIEFAFAYALKNKRRKVTLVHKANILKVLSGIFLHEGRRIADHYKGRVAFEERIVDACAMELVIKPETYDVIVTTNLFGDILSDLAAGLVGGLGLAPGANIGPEMAIFEAVHGSAPDIAGQDKANPLALLRAAILMLRYCDHYSLAENLEKAIEHLVIKEGVKTADLGGNVGTKDFTKLLIKTLGA